MSDRRVHPRYAVGLDCQVAHGGTSLAARTNDISIGGISFFTSTLLEVSSVLEMSLALVFPGDAFSEPLHLKGVVVWCTRMGDQYQVGAKFELLTSDTRRFLDLFLAFLEGELDDQETDPGPEEPH